MRPPRKSKGGARVRYFRLMGDFEEKAKRYAQALEEEEEGQADGASEASRESPRDDSGSDGDDATDSVGEPSALLLLRTPRTCTLRRSESSAAVERARLPNLTTRRGESSCGDVSESRGGVGGSEMRSLLPGL